jgi:hypothetical protein
MKQEGYQRSGDRGNRSAEPGSCTTIRCNRNEQGADGSLMNLASKQLHVSAYSNTWSRWDKG